MGNAADVNLVDYWQRDPELRRIRKLHRKGDFSTLPVCAACNVDEYHDVDLGSGPHLPVMPFFGFEPVKKHKRRQ